MPSGNLVLVITNVHGLRQRWSEGAYKPAESLLNKFIVGLVRAALGLKRHRSEAERRERERQELERKREEEARRHAEAQLRWREEQARVERLERLASVWRRNRELRQLVSELRDAIGKVDGDSELGRWVAWATDYAERSDPLKPLTERRETITLYYHGYDHDRVRETGFLEPDFSAAWSNDKAKAGVELTTRPPSVSAYPGALKMDLPEALVLPYEWPQESDWYRRVFRVPADLLNGTLKVGEP